MAGDNSRDIAMPSGECAGIAIILLARKSRISRAVKNVIAPENGIILA